MMNLCLKSLTDTGRFSGYASVFDVKDRNGDIVRNGAFKEFITKIEKGSMKMPRLLWQHDVNFPIGYIEVIREDNHGLYIEGVILRDLQKGDEAYRLIKSNAIDGFSIGYKVLESSKISGGKLLLKLDVLEISLVTLAANQQSVVKDIKTIKENLNNREVLIMENDKNVLEEIRDTIASGVKGIAETGFNIAESILGSKLQKFSDVLERTEKKMVSLDNKFRRPEFSIISDKGECDEKKGFEDYISKGIEKKNIGTKALSVEETGGYTIPDQIARKIYSTLASRSVIRRLSSSVQISSASLDILVDKDMACAGWAVDDSKRQEAAGQKLTKIKIPVHEVFSRTKATSQLLDDSNVDVEQWIINSVVERFSALENLAFLCGDGNHRPRGVLSYETSEDYEWGKFQEVKTGVDGGFNQSNPGDVLIDLVYSLKPQYMERACWLMPRSVVSEIRKMKDLTTGRYIWQSPIVSGDTPTLLGYPVEICDDLPSLKKGTASKSLIFGSFKDAYQIVDRQGIKILRDPFSSKPFVEFYITKRVGGDVVNFEALKVLNFSA